MMGIDTEAGRSVRRHGVLVGAVVSAAIAVGAMWGPWFSSGSASRNSFGFFRAAQVLGIEWVTPFRVAWFILPILLPLAVALVVFGARQLAAVTLACLGLVLAGSGALSTAGLGVSWGAVVAAAAGCCTIVAAAAALARYWAGAWPTRGRQGP